MWNRISNSIVRTKNFNDRSVAQVKPSHIIIHITGNSDIKSVINTFTNGKVSTHYLIDTSGSICQLVPDNKRAWHAGIDVATRSLYERVPGDWQCYLKYFSWYKGYPSDAIYLDETLSKLPDNTGAKFVMQSSGESWSNYDYFFERWGKGALPVNYFQQKDPNNYSIGIELLGFGSDKHTFTNEMYQSLRVLIMDLCSRYDIANRLHTVIGHEDVNPVARWGWDPGEHFDWQRARN